MGYADKTGNSSLSDIFNEGWGRFTDSFTVQTGGKGYKEETGPPTYSTDWGQVVSLAGLAGSASGLFGGDTTPPTGYQGTIPKYTARRQVVPNTYDPNRRAGSGGQRYFTDMQYTPIEEGTVPVEPMSAEGLAALNLSNPAQETKKNVGIAQENTVAGVESTGGDTNGFSGLDVQPAVLDDPTLLAAGGIAQLKQSKYLDGASDGMADKVPARIDGQQEARLSDGEFVVPADVVSHLGNGNSDAGAKVLKSMMTRVRKERTGNGKQGKQINPKKFLPA